MPIADRKAPFVRRIKALRMQSRQRRRPCADLRDVVIHPIQPLRHPGPDTDIRQRVIDGLVQLPLIDGIRIRRPLRHIHNPALIARAADGNRILLRRCRAVSNHDGIIGDRLNIGTQNNRIIRRCLDQRAKHKSSFPFPGRRLCGSFGIFTNDISYPESSTCFPCDLVVNSYTYAILCINPILLSYPLRISSRHYIRHAQSRCTGRCRLISKPTHNCIKFRQSFILDFRSSHPR